MRERVERTWGYYEVLDRNDNSVTKKLSLGQSRALSLQKHSNRTEVWTIISGTGIISTNAGDVTKSDFTSYLVKPGDTIIIGKNEWHSLSNISNTNYLDLIEVQYGDCKEEDIERFVK